MLEVVKGSNEPFEARNHSDGLEYAVPVGGHTMLGRKDLYVESVDSEVKGFIACYPSNSVPYPSCQQHFALSEEIRATVTHGKPLFSEWREIRSGVTKLLAGFETDATPSSPPVRAK